MAKIKSKMIIIHLYFIFVIEELTDENMCFIAASRNNIFQKKNTYKYFLHI